MRIDWLTKSLLAIIAVCLGVIAFNGTGTSPVIAQRSPVVIDTKFPTIQITGDQAGFYVFDGATGRIWFYSALDFRGQPSEVGRLEEPGRRLGR